VRWTCHSDAEFSERTKFVTEPPDSVAIPAGAEPFLALLRRYQADQTPHSGRHLLDHLAGTYRLLEAWGNPPATCRAGLFHSIYGTNLFSFRSAGLEERAVIAAAIGAEAERLAYLFCHTDRPLSLLQALIGGSLALPDLSGGAMPITAADLSALLEIEIANFLEQPEDPEVIAEIDRIIRAVDARAISPGAASALAAYLGL
jgi:hypothetical protein